MLLLRFLSKCLLAGLALLGALGSLSAAELQRFAFEKAAMGVPFRITLYAPGEVTAREAADAAFERVQVLNSIFSDYDPESELSRLSRTSGQGKKVPVSRELWLVLERAQMLAQSTNGAFDVTCGPVVNVWRRARRKQELPSESLIAEMQARVGWQKMRLDAAAQTVELLGEEMRLDCGALAKGYAVDAALSVLRERGIASALVAGSGDMAASGAPPGQTGWRIEVAAPDAAGAPPAQVVELRDSAIATSGDLYQRLEIGGRRYSHIIDPRTGVGLTDHSLVTVLARDCFTADSLATAVSVVGPEQGMKMIEETPGVSARIVRQPAGKLEIRTSSRWPQPRAVP